MIVFPKILADECVDRRLIDHLQSSGHYNKNFHFGTLLLRLKGMVIEEKKKLLLSVLQHHSDKLIGNFSVLTKDKLRIRKQEI